MQASTSGRPAETGYKRYRRTELEEEPQLELVESDENEKCAAAPETSCN